MKARHAYPLLFFIPSAMLAIIATVLAAASVAGVLWIFVYGDSPWPASADAVVMGFALCVGLALLAGLMLVAHRVGRARERAGGLIRAHALFALVLSVGLPLLVLLHQWQVGNLDGTKVAPNGSPKPTTPLRGAA